MAAMRVYELVNTLSKTANLNGCGLLFLCNMLYRNIQISVELKSLSNYNVTCATDLLKHLNLEDKDQLLLEISVSNCYLNKVYTFSVFSTVHHSIELFH